MSEERLYIDNETGKKVSLTSGAAAYLSDAKNRKGTGPRYTPADGKGVEVVIEDTRGNLRTEEMDAEAYYHTQQKAGKLGVSAVHDGNREQIEAVKADQLVRRADQFQAEATGAVGTFVANAIPGARYLHRRSLSEEQRATSARVAQLEDQTFPVAAIGGTLTQLAATAAIPIPGLGAVKGSKSAMSLFGFADEVGNATAKAVTASIGEGAVGKTLGKVVGNVVGGAAVNLPMSVQFQAAQALDYDRPLTSETFAADLGTHLLIGAAVDALLPGVGAVIRGARAAHPVTHGASELLRKVGPGARAVKSSAHKTRTLPFENMAGGSGAVGKIARGVQKFFNKNSARRVVGGGQLDDVAKSSANASKALETIMPSAVRTAKEGAHVVKALDDLAAANPQVLKSPLYETAKRGAPNLAGLDAGVKQVRGITETATEALSARIVNPEALTGVHFQGASTSAKLEMQMAASRVARDIGSEEGAEVFIKEMESALSSMKKAPADGARRLLAFRNRTVLDAAKSQDPIKRVFADAMRKHVDEVLTNSRTVGKAADEMRAILGASDDAIASVSALRNGLDDLSAIDKHTSMEGFRVGEAGASIDRANAALRELSNRGVVTPGNAGFIENHLGKLNEKLGTIATDLETAAAINALRGLAGGEFKAVTAGGTEATAGNLMTAMFDSAGRYINRVKNTVDDILNSAVKRSKVRTATTVGIYKYRGMHSFAEKEQAFNEAREEILAATSSDDMLINNVEKATANLQADPELASGVAMAAVVRANYLRDQLPTLPEGMVSYHDYKFSPAEVTSFLESYGAVDDPISMMQSAGEGTLSGTALQAVSVVYPNVLADMRVQLSQALIADQEKFKSLSYRQRIDIDTFLGGGFEPSAQPSALVNYQNRSAQTQAQDTALRGEGAMRAPQPGSDSSSDRLANF